MKSQNTKTKAHTEKNALRLPFPFGPLLSAMCLALVACGGSGNTEASNSVASCPTAPTTFTPTSTQSTSLTGHEENALVAAYGLAEAAPSAGTTATLPTFDGSKATGTDGSGGTTISQGTEFKDPGALGSFSGETAQLPGISTGETPPAAPPTSPPAAAVTECTGACIANKAAAEKFGTTEGTQEAQNATQAKVDTAMQTMETKNNAATAMSPCPAPANFVPPAADASKSNGQANDRSPATNDGKGGAQALPSDLNYGTDLKVEAKKDATARQTEAAAIIGAVSTSEPKTDPQASNPPATQECMGGLSANSGSQIGGAGKTDASCTTQRGNKGFTLSGEQN